MSEQPNFLFVQADQLAARILPAYGNRIADTPNMDRLAEEGIVFENAYCNYPLCAPSRFSMMSGLLATKAGAFDNGAEFPASLPTFAHYLRILGYQTCLSGKMHFIGPDQLHGFEERLTTDIYPSDFNWTANWDAAAERTADDRLLAAAGEVNGVANAGIYEHTIQRSYDDEVAFTARRKIHALAHSDDNRPFCLFVSFTHPHDPFAVPRIYWDRYRHEDIDMPAIPAQPRELLDPHSQRLYDHIGVADAAMSDEKVRVARHAYYGAVSYIDDQLGALLDELESNGLRERTIVILLSDHGEALGERGLWFKRSFFDCAMRIPFVVNAPSHYAPSRFSGNVSLVDLFPTLIDLADSTHGLARVETPYDGRSLRPALEGLEQAGQDTDQVMAELTSEGLSVPAVMVRNGKYKMIHCPSDPPLLFDLEADPEERINRYDDSSLAEVRSQLSTFIDKNWDFDELSRRVIADQRRRRIVDRAHASGRPVSWDYTVPAPGDSLYFRPCPQNPSASNYNESFELRVRPDSGRSNVGSDIYRGANGLAKTRNR